MRKTVAIEGYKSVEVYGVAWLKRAKKILEKHAPQIRKCAKCGNPVADGYICSFCGHDDSDD